MILIDTSAWIDFFRGNGRLADSVDDALATGEATVCGPIVSELRRGLLASQRKQVLHLLSGCSILEAPAELWVEAGDLGHRLGRKGVTIKTLDLLIAVHAIFHDAELLTADTDFRQISKAGVGLRLA
jgi:predicted nucleic acid-binding protein